MSNDNNHSNNEQAFWDLVAFRTMITPVFGVVIFWLGAALMTLGALFAIAEGDVISGTFGWAFGVLIWRLVCEWILVLFLINQNLSDIRRGLNETTQAVKDK